MDPSWLKTISILGLILVLTLSNFVVYGEVISGQEEVLQSLNPEENLEETCLWERIEERPENLSDEEYEVLLKKCQAYYQEKSLEIEEDITKTEQERRTLQSKIYTLRKKIENLGYQIYQSNLVIKDIGLQVEDTEASIGETTLKIGDSRRQLINILRVIYETDQKSLIEILLSEKELSDFFDDLMALEALGAKNRELLENIENLKTYLEIEKESLSKEKRGLEKMVIIQSLQKQESEEIKQDQEYFLKMTEEEYQQYLQEKKETEETVAKISAKLWNLLIGVREIPEYGEAVKIAQFVEEQTGVRAAFLLGVLTQESRIGRNVGQCFLTNPETGMGQVAFNGEIWPRVMKPSRDVPIFLEIIEELNRTKNLNLRSNRTPVSCWIPYCATYYGGRLYTCGASVGDQGNIICSRSGYLPYGWGGAMGAAQFIPSTWNIYKEEIKNRTGEAPDPWDFRHASLAAALLLTKCGALSSERKAAVCYLGADYLGYADSVLSLAKCHQAFIDTGSMSSECQERIGLQ